MKKNLIKSLPNVAVQAGVALFFTGLLIMLHESGFGQASVTYTTSGIFMAPAGVTSVQVECWGGGGAGGGRTGSVGCGGGGGGGAYTLATGVPVVPGTVYTITVGLGATGTNNSGSGGGASSAFLVSTVTANGGGGGTNGGTAGLGGTGGTYNGGNGAEGHFGDHGGGGGGSAGTASNGNPGTEATGASAVTGGGPGGNGRTGGYGNGFSPASGPGGGGGGCRWGDAEVIGGSGANGQVIVSWACALVVTNFNTAASSPVCTNGISTVTVNSSTLVNGTYTVYYNLSGANTATAQSASMIFSSGSGTFSTIALANSGSTTVTITSVGCAIPATNYTSIVTVDAVGIISGAFTYYNLANTPLTSGITVELWQDGSQVGSDYTVTGGTYSFSGLCPGTYEIRASSENSTVGAVNTTDAGQTNYWGTHPYEIERVRFGAGDVTDAALFINATDAQHIQQNFVNGTVFEHGKWAFWKAGETISSNFPDPPATSFPKVTVGIEDVTANFYGMCIGDFNRSFMPGLKISASETVELVYGETSTGGCRQEFELPVKIVNETGVGAVSLILEYPSKYVEILDVSMSGVGGMLDWAVSGDELRIGWNSINPLHLDAGAELLTLKLKTTAAFTKGNTIRLSLAPDPLNELADARFNVIGDAVLSIQTIESTSSGIQDQEPETRNLKLSNYPNPFSNMTTISYSLPFEGKVVLDICNIFGRKVTTLVSETQTAGNHVVKFDSSCLPNGIFTATLKVRSSNDEAIKTIKLINNK